jgi:hypothetical protein
LAAAAHDGSLFVERSQVCDRLCEALISRALNPYSAGCPIGGQLDLGALSKLDKRSTPLH